MSGLLSLIGSLPGGVALALLSAILVPLGGLLGVLISQRAPLQKTVNDAVRIILEAAQRDLAESRADRSRLLAQSSEQEGFIKAQSQRIELLEDLIGGARRDLREARQQLSGDLANVRQVQESSLRLSDRQGTSPIPPESKLRKDD